LILIVAGLEIRFWTAATFNVPDSTVSVNCEEKVKQELSNRSSHSHKFGIHVKTSNYLTLNGECKEDRKDSKKCARSNSTLSLHISAYENSVENAASSGHYKKITTTNFVKKCNQHEFPRQQDDDDQATAPEVMQFKASQRLLSPNHSPLSKKDSSKVNNILCLINSKYFNEPPNPPIFTEADRTAAESVESELYVSMKFAIKILI
jgi:hypothetical protein